MCYNFCIIDELSVKTFEKTLFYNFGIFYNAVINIICYNLSVLNLKKSFSVIISVK